MDQHDELISKINAIPEQELGTYLSMTKSINFIISCICVGLMTLVLFYPSIIGIVCTAIIAYFMGKVSEGVSLSKKLIIERIAKIT